MLGFVPQPNLRTDNYYSAIPSQSSPIEVNFAEIGIIEVSTSQIAIFKSGLPEVSLIPDSIAKVAANKDATTFIVDPSKVSTTEIGFLPITVVSPASISEISFPQNSTTKVNNDDGTLKINTTQINTSEQSFTRILNNNFGKISLSSSISPQQFFNSNFVSLDPHSSIPLLDNIYSTVNTKISKQNRLLNSNFDLTFQITDLPTGQLAEAQVTHYTNQGIPNGGKILIYHNANGLGWFIDPTNFDHSEISQTLADTVIVGWVLRTKIFKNQPVIEIAS